MTGINGNYRVDSSIFPVPTTRWEEQPIAPGLNGIPVLSSYKIHTWNWPFLLGEVAELLFNLFDSQQSTGTPLTTLETDPYDGSLSDETYGTETYDDFTILSLSPRTRGLPFYDDVTITFEVYVS